MSSIPVNAPSRKLLLTALTIVVGLHVLTAIILAGVEMPTPITEPLVQTPSIEIELMALPAQTERVTADGKVGTEEEVGQGEKGIKSGFESETKDVASETKDVASETIIETQVLESEIVALDSEVENIIEPENIKTDVVEEVTIEPEFIAPEAIELDITELEATEPAIHPAPTQTPATELNLLSGTTSTVETTIKKSGSDGTVTISKGVSGEDGASPIAGGYAPFSRAPQSPMAGNIITNNNDTNGNDTYQNANPGMNNYNETGKSNNGSSLITIVPAPPFEHELVEADYEITDAHWLIEPKFTAINLDNYQLYNDENTSYVTVYFSMSVNAKGYIKDITIIRSSGSNKLDQIIKQDLMKARLRPFDKNDQSLADIATIALKIEIN